MKGTVTTVTTQFCINKYSEKCAIPYSLLTLSSSLIISAGTTKPAMQPIGMARPPSAVESARSLSPNQTVAILLAQLAKNT
jgi:hypothetical protein